METIRGKKSLAIDGQTLAALARRYDDILIDLGTGDGRYVRHVAQACPGRLAIGIDACRENLRDASRRAPENALYVIANALALPSELSAVATQVTINFPWGSLLTGLLNGHDDLMDGLSTMARPGAELDIRVNAGALAEEGWELGDGAERIREVVGCAGFLPVALAPLEAAALHAVRTTWARRLAAGRDPRAMHLRATYPIRAHDV